MKNGKLSIGLIGAGRAGMIHARNLRASVPHAALTTVADPVEAAARAGVHVNGLSAYYMEHPEDCPPATVVLGYSDMDERALRAAVDALRCAWGARPPD